MEKWGLFQRTNNMLLLHVFITPILDALCLLWYEWYVKILVDTLIFNCSMHLGHQRDRCCRIQIQNLTYYL